MEVKQIKETCLYVDDLEKSKAFYHEKLGFPVINYDRGNHIFFRVGSSVLLCFIPEQSRKKAKPPPHYAHGNQHIAFEVDPEDYNSWKEKISLMNVDIIDEVTWKDGQESFYFKDPEENVLEIVPYGVWE